MSQVYLKLSARAEKTCVCQGFSHLGWGFWPGHLPLKPKLDGSLESPLQSHVRLGTEASSAPGWAVAQPGHHSTGSSHVLFRATQCRPTLHSRPDLEGFPDPQGWGWGVRGLPWRSRPHEVTREPGNDSQSRPMWAPNRFHLLTQKLHEHDGHCSYHLNGVTTCKESGLSCVSSVSLCNRGRKQSPLSAGGN